MGVALVGAASGIGAVRLVGVVFLGGAAASVGVASPGQRQRLMAVVGVVQRALPLVGVAIAGSFVGVSCCPGEACR